MHRMVIAAAFVMLSLSAGPAWAHKVIASVYASGAVIEGEIGFSNGDMAANVLVRVTDQEGNVLGEAMTGENGVFTFTPTKAVAHVFRADLGAGHVAEVTMAAEDLPPSLHNGAMPVAKAAAPENAAPSAGIDDRQRDLLAEMVRREVKPLRQEIAAYKEKNDLQSILGGIGYIAGLFGLGFFLSARRRLKEL